MDALCEQIKLLICCWIFLLDSSDLATIQQCLEDASVCFGH